jgi:uncharacterized protein
MRTMTLLHNGRPRPLGVLVCDHPLESVRACLARRQLGHDGVLLIRPCAGVHTLGLRHELDIVFSRFDGAVLRCVRSLRPGRIAWARGADAAWEMSAGQALRLGIRVGDQLGVAWARLDHRETFSPAP